MKKLKTVLLGLYLVGRMIAPTQAVAAGSDANGDNVNKQVIKQINKLLNNSDLRVGSSLTLDGETSLRGVTTECDVTLENHEGVLSLRIREYYRHNYKWCYIDKDGERYWSRCKEVVETTAKIYESTDLSKLKLISPLAPDKVDLSVKTAGEGGKAKIYIAKLSDNEVRLYFKNPFPGSCNVKTH